MATIFIEYNIRHQGAMRQGTGSFTSMVDFNKFVTEMRKVGGHFVIEANIEYTD